MLEMILIFLLSVAVILLAVVCNRQRKEVYTLIESMHIVDELLGRHNDAMAEFDHRLTKLERSLPEAEEIIKARAEYEKEAEKAEQLFQEGLQNILNYGVIKNG